MLHAAEEQSRAIRGPGENTGHLPDLLLLATLGIGDDQDGLGILPAGEGEELQVR